MKQVHLSFFTLVFALFVSASAFAHDIEAVNADGVTIYYKWINDSTELAVSYRTSKAGDGGYYIYNGYTGSVIIPESVMYNDVSYSVTSIDDSAFEGCTGLVSVTIPKSVTSIGTYIFYGCSLSSIIVEADNTKYDSRENCNAIIETSTDMLKAGCKNTTIPQSVTGIASYAFLGCSDLASVTIPEGVTSIGRGAFSECI